MKVSLLYNVKLNINLLGHAQFALSPKTSQSTTRAKSTRRAGLAAVLAKPNSLQVCVALWTCLVQQVMGINLKVEKLLYVRFNHIIAHPFHHGQVIQTNEVCELHI